MLRRIAALKRGHGTMVEDTSMTVNVECPDCGKAYHVGDESIGARAKCKSCGATFTLSMSMDDTGKSKSDVAPAGNAPPKAATDRSAHGKASSAKPPPQPAAAAAAGKAAQEQMPDAPRIL
jgi:predicted Zn finger-like uncharacterized protein